MIYREGDTVQAKQDITAAMLSKSGANRVVITKGTKGIIHREKDVIQKFDPVVVVDWEEIGEREVRFAWIEPEIKTPGLTFQNVAVWDIYGVEDVWRILTEVTCTELYAENVVLPITDDFLVELGLVDSKHGQIDLILSAFNEAKNRGVKYLIVMDSTNDL